MALKKLIESDSGIPIEYHRITTLTIMTNVQNTIEVGGYISESKRIEEKDAMASGELPNVFVEARFYTIPYDPEMDIAGAYEYVKMLPEFEGAVDV